MDKVEIEKYKRELEEIESKFTDEALQEMSKEEIKEYLALVAGIKVRLEVLDRLS